MRSKVRKICRLLSIIDRIRIERHSRLDKQWRLLRILSIYAKNTTFSVLERIETNQPYYTTLAQAGCFIMLERALNWNFQDTISFLKEFNSV